MRSWLIEIIDQIALGEYLAQSDLSCGKRFGLIAIDNAVEFMLVAHVEINKRLIGSKQGRGIPKKDWEETKRNFPPLLAKLVELEPNLAPLEDEINRFHDFRNRLYHTEHL